MFDTARRDAWAARLLRALSHSLLDMLVLAALLLAALGAGLLAYRLPRSTLLTMDSPESLLPRDGMYRYEHFPENAGTFSWSSGDALLRLPNPGGQIRLRVRLFAPSSEPMPARLRAGDVAYDLVALQQPRVYRLLLPPSASERAELRIDSERVRARKRDLGVGLGDMQIAGGGAAPARALLALALATVGGYVLLRRVGWRPGWAAGCVLALQLAALAWQQADGWRYALLSMALAALGAGAIAAVLLERWLPPAAHGQLAARAWLRRDTWLVLVLLALALALRLPLLFAPDPVGDLELSARRMGFLYANGLAGAFTDGGDYMPLRLYLLWGMSKLVPLLGGAFTAPLPAATQLLIKLPGLLADLASIALIYGWARCWRSSGGALAIAALYALAPPVWINVAWWGQVDALLMLPLLCVVLLLDRGEARWSWLAWALAMLIKTQAILLVPMLVLATLRRYGCRSLLRGAALAGATLLGTWAPLLLIGQMPGLIDAYSGSVERFPRTTVAAYNLWFLVLRGGSDRDTERFMWGLSYRQAGMGLLVLAVLLIAVALLRRSDAPARAEAAAALALAFFCLPTQIHERYLFLTLAFLVLRAAVSPWLLAPYLALVLTATLNILGTLSGFMPSVYTAMQESQAPLWLAALNLLVCALLIGHLLLAAWRGAPDHRPHAA